MSLNLSGFIQAAFKKQSIAFNYNDLPYELNFYSAYLNKKEVAEYFLDAVGEITTKLSEENPEDYLLLMKFYMRFQKSEELTTRVPRIVRRGHRKFDVRTLVSKTNTEKSKKFKTSITFDKIEYKNNILDARKRYDYLVEKMRLEDGKNPDLSNLFEKAIFIREIQDLEIDEIAYENYLSDFIIKLNNWEEREKLFIDEKYNDEETNQDIAISKIHIREIHDQFILFFKDEVDNPLFKKLFYDLEGLYFWFWETILLEVYDFIKSSLSEAERKAFLLSYTRQEYLDYHIPIFEPLGEEFINLLNPEERIEFLYAFLFNEDSENKLLNKFDDKFTDFIKFYPVWVDIIRLDENLNEDDKLTIQSEPYFRGQRIIGTKEGKDVMGNFDSLFQSVNRKGDGLTLEEEIGDIIPKYSKLDIEALNKIISDELTQKEREVINLILDESGFTQEQIAAELNISQSAINQRYKNAIKKIQKAFEA